MPKKLLLFLLPILLLPSLALAQTTTASGSLSIDFSKVQVNAAKQTAFNRDINNIVTTLKAHVSGLGASRITKIVMLYPNDTNTTCNIKTRGVVTDGCYFPDSGQLVLNSDVFGRSADSNEVIAHEILHSYRNAGNGSALPNSAENGVAWEEMLVEYFAQQSYPSSLGGYDWLEPFVPAIKNILSTAGEADPDTFLANALFKGNLTELNNLIGPYLTASDFLAGLGQYINIDPAKTKTAAANAYLASVQQKAAQCNAPSNTDTAGTNNTNTTSTDTTNTNSTTPPATCPIKTTSVPTTPDTSGNTTPSPAAPVTPIVAGVCNGTFSPTEVFQADGLLPPFLRSADAAQNADFSCIGAGIKFYTSFLALIIGIAAFFYVLYGAFLYMTAFGDDAKATQAKKVITQAIVGLVLASLAYGIISIVNTTLGGGASLPK
jgi:hypothetical protein